MFGRLLLLSLVLGTQAGCHANTDAPAGDETETAAPERETGARDSAGETGRGGTGIRDTGETGSGDTGDTGRDTGFDPDGPCTTVYAVRHAEKDSEGGSDPGLTEAGTARALALVDVMHDVPLTAVYATELLRTQETVAPTAADHGLPIDTDYDPEEELAEHILATNVGETVLHAGHGYTLTDFFEALGVADAPYPDGYGELWIVRVYAEGTVTIETSTYGE